MVRKGKKKEIQNPFLLLAIKIFTFFQPSLLFQPSRLLVFYIFSNPLPNIPHPYLLETWEYTLFLLFVNIKLQQMAKKSQ